ncbi:response regulator transcription factor [Ramlibacter montanisoli]|uniref:response regulator transcription factor n=1 Tax=Ramlibacter montanisoli TaxID=2732512 RepID=UPI0028159CE1|nr:response regulator [Ramlibacter montanisoli]
MVDDDSSVREALPDLLEVFGFASEAFASAEEFLAARPPPDAQALILDVAMPGMTGPELFAELKRRGSVIPVIFITAQADPALQPRLLAQGAASCLFKPFSEVALFAAVESALEH